MRAITNTTSRCCEYTIDKRSLDNNNELNQPNSIETTIHLLAKVCSSSIKKNNDKTQLLLSG